MKNKILSKAYGGVTEARHRLNGLGLPRQWKVITSTLLLLFTFAIGNVWAANTPAAAGTYVASSSKKPGGENKFYKLGNGVYIHRRNNSSWNSSLGMKTTSANTNGLAVYVSSSMNFSGLIKKSSSKNAVTVQFDIYTLTNGSTAFDSFESGTDNSTTVSVTLSSTPTYTTTVSFEALATNAAEEKSSSNLALAAGYYYIVPHETASIGKTFIYSITLTAASKDDPTITFNDGAYTVGGSNLDLSSLFSSNSDGAVTYTVKTDGGTSASISGSSFSATAAGTAVVTASQAATSSYNAATADANIVVSVPSTPTHEITYTNLKGSDVSAYPTEFYEGVGIASFDPLADVTDFHFNGWSPASIGTDVATDVEMTATWVAAYDVTFNINGGTGSAPDAFQKWEGATFELPGQGSMVAPSGRVFGGWKAGGTKYAASAEYTMTNAAVEFVAQWDLLVEQVLYSWEGAEGGATEVGGTATHYNADAAVDGNPRVNYKTTANSIDYYTISLNGKADYSTDHIRIALTANAKAGDKVKMTAFYSKDSEKTVAPKIANSTNAELVTGSTPPNIYSSGVPALQTVILPVGADEAELRLTRSTTATNVFITKLQIVHEKAVPEEDIRTVTFNTNGGSAIAAVSVEKGTAVAQPADPTKAHCRFEGWQLSGSDYDFSSAVNSNITLDAVWTQLYTISFAAGDGSGDAPAAIADKAKDETFEVPANTFTAPASKEFDKWNDGSAAYAPGATYTVGTANVVLTAQWKAVTAKYTVIFKDGETTLDTKLFEVGSNPSDADIDKTKPLFAFAAWQKEGVDIALDDAFWATVVKDATVTLTARWTKVYAQDADLEGLVESEGTSADWQAYMSGKGYAYSTSGVSLDAKAGGKDYNNWPYQGLKAKEIGAYVEGRIAADKLVIIKLGHMAAAANVSLDGVAAGTATGLDADEPAGQLNYFYVENESVLRYETTNGGACVLKAITITNPFQVTFNPNGGDPVASQYGHPSVTLPDASNGTKSLLGWFDAAEGGNKIGDVGESYTPAADIELFAQWEAVSTDARLSSISFSSAAGTLEPAFDPEVVNYTYTMPYPTAAVPTITGATSVSAKAKTPVIDAQAANWGDVAHIHGVAESDDTKDYYITMKIAPKDGVSIIKVATTGGTNKTVTGLYAGDGDVNLSSNTKMDNGKYIGFTLDGTTLQAGDRINVHTTEAANTGGSHIIFYDNMTSKTELYETGEIGGTGDNIFEINAAMVGSATAYVYRANNDAAHQWNGKVNFIEVLRAMNPVLTAITIDGRDGEIDALDDKHFSVTIPYEADLAALTVVPTIVRNAAHPTTPEAVISNEGAWILGDNTYRIMDKDGDYNDYTITLDRDVLKHTVSFNTHGGTAVVSELVEDGGYLAAAPADPTKEDYIFQYWSEDEDGAEVDVTTVQINADKEFHAVWASDGAIKLLDGATVNHTNFITGVTADETVEFKGNEVHYAAFTGTISGVNGVKDPTRVIAYNATTNKTKIRIYAHNNSTSGRNILVKGLVEGADAATDLATIALGNKEDKISDWIEFNNAANRTIYIFVPSSAGDVYFTQVKVIESGENAMKQAGEAGYALNLNKGRFFGLASTDLAFEGLNARLSGDYTALNSGYAKLASTSMSFTVAAPTLLKVTTNNNKTYYVTEGAAGTDNETAKAGESEFTLTAGTWFITAGASEVQFTNLAFELPKCQQPTVVDMENIGLCEGDAFTALTVSASVSDGGTLHYQWYKHPAAGDDEAVGTDDASYTPEADGQYYVVVTNKLADHSDNSKTSNTVTIEHFASAEITTAPLNKRGEVDDVVTLSVVATGKNLSYKWFKCDDESGTNPVAIDPEETNASLNVTITAGMNQWYKVLVTSDCGNAEATARVSEFEPTAPANVTGSITWDWKSTTAGFPTENTSIDFTNTSVEELFADVDAAMPNNEYFRSDMLYGIGQRAWRKSNNDGECGFQGFQIRFNTEVAGRVRVYFRAPSSGQTSVVTIDGKPAGSRGNSWGWSEYVDVEASTNVIIAMTNGETGMTRVQKIEFEERVDQRGAGWAAAGELGTVCLESDAVVTGANLYELAGLDVNGYLAFDQILNGELEAGKPYLFEATSNALINFYAPVNAGTADQAEVTNGMHGTFTNKTFTASDESIYYFSGRHIWAVKDFIVSITIPAHYCYVDMSELQNSGASEAPAPGRRRISMSIMGSQIATGIENTGFESEAPRKVLINGELYILRGEKMYDAKGQLVK